MCWSFVTGLGRSLSIGANLARSVTTFSVWKRIGGIPTLFYYIRVTPLCVIDCFEIRSTTFVLQWVRMQCYMHVYEGFIQVLVIVIYHLVELLSLFLTVYLKMSGPDKNQIKSEEKTEKSYRRENGRVFMQFLTE